MPTSLNVTAEPEAPRKIPKLPEDRPLPAHNFCHLCMYNIPSGSLMILIPGLVLLLTGTVAMTWTQVDDSWNGDLTLTSLMFLVIGGVLTLTAIIYWCTMWLKYRPKVTNKHQAVSPGGTAASGTSGRGNVELLGMYKHNAREEGYVNPAMTTTDPDAVVIATIT